MGIGCNALALYHEFARLGLFSDLDEIVELGNQKVGCDVVRDTTSY